MIKQDIEYSIRHGKRLFWAGPNNLLFDPIIELTHWTRDKWFGTVIDDSGQLNRTTIRSNEIADWTAGSAEGIESARRKIDAFDARKAANAQPLDVQPTKACVRSITDTFEPAW